MPASESGYDVIIMFGLFESKEAKFWRAETIQTLKIADQRFDDRKKKTIATNVLKRILDLLKELDGLTAKEKKEIMKGFFVSEKPLKSAAKSICPLSAKWKKQPTKRKIPA